MIQRTAPPGLLVFVTDYHIRLTYAGAKGDEYRGKPGDFYLNGGGVIGLDNLTNEPATTLRVHPRCTWGVAQGSTTVKPPGDKFENECFRMERLRRGPHERTAPEAIPPTVVIPITEMRLKVSCADGRTEVIVQKPRDVYWERGGVCSMENLADTPLEEVRVIPKSEGSGKSKK